MSNKRQTTLQESGIIVLVGTFLMPFLQVLLLFVAAEAIQNLRVWLYLAVSLLGMFGGIVIVAMTDPELVNARGYWRRRKDNMPGDKLLILLYGVCTFCITPLVVGLDVGRRHGSSLGVWAAVVGTLLFGLGSILITWAMLVNTHFETTVRIQRDRNHRVISTGPYSILRHPGYLGANFWALGMPLIVGSPYGLLPAAIAIAAFTVRLVLEERTLRTGLPGYAEYARRVGYRLLPGIW